MLIENTSAPALALFFSNLGFSLLTIRETRRGFTQVGIQFKGLRKDLEELRSDL